MPLYVTPFVNVLSFLQVELCSKEGTTCSSTNRLNKWHHNRSWLRAPPCCTANSHFRHCSSKPCTASLVWTLVEVQDFTCCKAMLVMQEAVGHSGLVGFLILAVALLEKAYRVVVGWLVGASRILGVLGLLKGEGGALQAMVLKAVRRCT